MFKFLFGGKKTPDVTIETDRVRFARLISELNEMVDGLPAKPKVTIDPETGHIDLETPEQFHDEALALPKPEASDAAPETETPSEDAASDATEAPKSA